MDHTLPTPQRTQLNYSKHYIRQVKPATAVQTGAQQEEVAQFQLRLQDAIDHYGPEYVSNADEMFAKQVEHPNKSIGVAYKQNIVRSELNKKNGITTTPFVSAAGDKLGLQAIAKGTTQRSLKNRQLPPEIAGDFSGKG